MMAKKHLSLNPKQVTDKIWYYEELEGIQVCHDVHYVNGTVEHFIIPWRMLRASLKRKDKK